MSKIGPHIIKPTADALTWARAAGVVKALDDPAALKVAPPNALRIFRAYFPDDQQKPSADPANVAATILARLGGYRHPRLYVETFNETQWPAADLIAFHQRIVPVLHAAGVKVCGPCWSTGAYTPGDWATFRAAGWCGLDAVALHAYWGNQGFTVWHATRWRTYWRPGDPPIVITECGRDRVEGGKGGWRADGLSEDAYAAELLAYDAEIGKDACVAAATVFTAGPTPDWRNFDTDPLTERMVKHAGPLPDFPDYPPKETTMRLGLLFRMGADVPEKNVDELAALCARGGFSAICPKAMDGTSWEGSFDSDPVLAIKDQRALLAQRDVFATYGLAYEPWVVYRGIDAEAEAEAHATVARLCGTMIVDFEWMYPGFADHGDFGDAVAYFANLRAKAPSAQIVFCPDPRQLASKAFDIAAIAPYVSWSSDQCYFTDFQQPWRTVLEAALASDHAGLDFCPMLPGNSTPEELDAAITHAMNVSGSGAARTIYVFQRVGLRDDNLPVLAKHAEMWTMPVNPPTPTQEDDVPLLKVDTAAYERDYWAPIYAQLAANAAMVAKLRATGNHADALLADAIEKSGDGLRPVASLHKIICGAEAA